jgi:hypothetical protein
VVFWSLGSAVYYSGVIVFAVLLFLGLLAGFSYRAALRFWPIVIALGLIAVATVLALPLRNAAFVYAPFLCLLGTPKLLIAVPWLAPVAACAWALQLAVALFCGGTGARELNKLVLILLLLAAFVHLPSTFPTFNDAGQTIGQLGGGSPIASYLSSWVSELPAMTHCGVVSVEAGLAGGYERCRVGAVLYGRPADPWRVSERPWSLGVAAYFICFFLARHFRLPGERKKKPALRTEADHVVAR